MDGMRQSQLDLQIDQCARSTQAVQMQSCILRNLRMRHKLKFCY